MYFNSYWVKPKLYTRNWMCQGTYKKLKKKNRRCDDISRCSVVSCEYKLTHIQRNIHSLLHEYVH